MAGGLRKWWEQNTAIIIRKPHGQRQRAGGANPECFRPVTLFCRRVCLFSWRSCLHYDNYSSCPPWSSSEFSVGISMNGYWHWYEEVNIRVWWCPWTFLTTHDNQLPSMSGVHSLKDFLCSAHLLESFDGRIYTYGSVLKSKFIH